MGLVDDIAREAAVEIFVKKIKEEIEENNDKPEVVKVLKKLGRFALEQLEWTAPTWEDEYTRLFAD